MVSLFKDLVHEVEVEANNKLMKVNIMYDGNPRVCIGCGDFGHYHGNCEDEAGTGRSWSRYQQGNLPMSLTVPPVQRGGGETSNQPNREQQQQHQQHNVPMQNSVDVQAAGCEDIPVHDQGQREEVAVALNLEQREGGAEQWDDNMLEPIMDLTLELSLPLTDWQGPITSPTIYSSASDGSLHFHNEGVGGWRMAVPDVDVAFEDLDLEDMIDQNANLLLGLQEDTQGNTNQWPGLVVHEGQLVERAMEDNTVHKSPYKRAALLDLQIAPDIQDKEGNNANDKGDEGCEAPNTATLNKGKQAMKIAEGGDDDLGEEIARVMRKVDCAMEGLVEKEGGRKMKRAVENSAEEIRRLACMLNTTESVDAFMMNEDGAVLFISSESSGDSLHKKRKRRDRNVDRAGSVASRLRKKDKQVAQLEAGEVNTMSNVKKKIKKMAVRKIKVSAARPTTSLTLAPPMPGFPTP